MTVEEWLASRTPRPPAALAERMRAVLARAPGEAPPAHAPETYIVAAEALLARLLRDGCSARQAALDLLVADALVTYAFEAAGTEPARLVERAEFAIARITDLADAGGVVGGGVGPAS